MKKKIKENNDKILSILQKLKQERYGKTFARPVTEELAPLYFTKILQPIDFLTIEKRIIRSPNYYKRPEIFAIEMRRMFSNCQIYNGQESSYYRQAVDGIRKFNQLYSTEFPDYLVS